MSRSSPVESSQGTVAKSLTNAHRSSRRHSKRHVQCRGKAGAGTNHKLLKRGIGVAVHIKVDLQDAQRNVGQIERRLKRQLIQPVTQESSLVHNAVIRRRLGHCNGASDTHAARSQLAGNCSVFVLQVEKDASRARRIWQARVVVDSDLDGHVTGRRRLSCGGGDGDVLNEVNVAKIDLQHHVHIAQIDNTILVGIHGH